MHKILASTLVLSLIGLAGCPDVKTDPDEEFGTTPPAGGPTVEFDPAASIIPFPNNLVLDPATGKVTLPQQCGEGLAAKVLRTQVLNTLDGFGTYEAALQVTFTDAFDMASLDGHVLLYQVQKGGAPNDPTTAKPIPVSLIPGMAIRYDAGCTNPHPVPALNIVAQGALEQRATYAVAITKGVKTTGGTEFLPSFFWGIVDQPNAPVTFDAAGNVVENHTPLKPEDPAQLAQLQGINLLWTVHKGILDFLTAAGVARADVLLAWSFNTQSNDALDPTAVATAKISASPAAQIPTNVPLSNVQPIPDCSATNPTNCVQRTLFQCADGESNGQCFMKFVFGQGNRTRGEGLCAQAHCEQVAEVLTAKLTSRSYQQPTPNPLGAGGALIPGPFSDSSRPMFVKNDTIDVLVFVPVANATPPSGTVVFGHGLGSTKNSAAIIAPGLASKGFATVAIDFVAHDSRAVRISSTGGCIDVGGRPPPATGAPQCYAPFLSTDLAGTRDNIRQSVLDMLGLVASLKACGQSVCGPLKVDSAHMSYMGISLGGIIGTTVVANATDFKSAVLNVPGVGLIDILENTASKQIRCTLVNGLIDAGVVIGEKSDAEFKTGTCQGEEWKTQPGYQQFAVIGRWILDPADGANFTRKLAAKKFIIQEVVNDEVVPNIATDREGALVGLMPAAADPLNPLAAPQPSVAITTNPTANKWVRYAMLPATADPAFPGNTFQHASLLSPAAGTAGLAGTIRVQTDAITYLVLNH